MYLLLRKGLPVVILLALTAGCSVVPNSKNSAQLAISMAKIAAPDSVTTVKLADYGVHSPFTEVVHIVRLPDGQFLALSAKDPNGGCIVPWNQQAQVFWNPCHGAQYNIRGEVKDGPAIRGLDHLAIRASAKDRTVYVDLVTPPTPGTAR